MKKELVEELQKELPYVVQKMEKGSILWKTVSEAIRGKAKCEERMVEIKAEKGNKQHSFRVVPVNEADKYNEGVKIGRMLGPDEDEKPRGRRRPLMALPEHL